MNRAIGRPLIENFFDNVISRPTASHEPRKRNPAGPCATLPDGTARLLLELKLGLLLRLLLRSGCGGSTAYAARRTVGRIGVSGRRGRRIRRILVRAAHRRAGTLGDIRHARRLSI